METLHEFGQVLLSRPSSPETDLLRWHKADMLGYLGETSRDQALGQLREVAGEGDRAVARRQFRAIPCFGDRDDYVSAPGQNLSRRS